MVIKKETGDREIRLIASQDKSKESIQEIVKSIKDIWEDKTKFEK